MPLGLAYLMGRGVTRDVRTAEHWLTRAAEAGQVQAMFRLGTLLGGGRGLGTDLVRSAHWLERASDAEQPLARMELAHRYRLGRGLPRDEAHAARLYQSLAEGGWTTAKVALAYLYLDGRGVPKDLRMAAKLLREAADSNFTPAQIALGMLYEEGLGVERNLVEAEFWYGKAERAGFPETDKFKAHLNRSASKDETMADDPPPSHLLAPPGPVAAVTDIPALLADAKRLMADSRHVEASKAARRALISLEKAHGPNDPSVVDAILVLADSLGRQLYPSAAETLLRRALAIREAASGGEIAPDTAAVLEKLGYNLVSQMRRDEARHLFERALTIREAAYGKDHPDVTPALEALASNWIMDDPAKTEELCRQILLIKERPPASAGKSIANTMVVLALAISRQGRSDEAEQLYLQSIEVAGKYIGLDSPDMDHFLTNIAMFYSSHAQPKKYIEYLKRAVDIRDRTLGPDHPSLAMPLAMLGTALTTTGNPREAEKVCWHAYQLAERAFGPDSPSVGTPMLCIATAQMQQGGAAGAKDYLNRGMALFKKGKGAKTSEAYEKYLDGKPLEARSLAEEAGRWASAGHYGKAAELYRQALGTTRRALGDDNKDVWLLTVFLANNLAQNGQNEEAIEIFRELLSTGGPFRKLGKAFEMTNQMSIIASFARFAPDEAESMLQRNITTYADIHGDAAPILLVYMQQLEIVYVMQERIDDALAVSRRMTDLMLAASRETGRPPHKIGWTKPLRGTLFVKHAIV